MIRDPFFWPLLFYSVSFHLVYLCVTLDTSRQTLLWYHERPVQMPHRNIISPLSLSFDYIYVSIIPSSSFARLLSIQLLVQTLLCLHKKKNKRQSSSVSTSAHLLAQAGLHPSSIIKNLLEIMQVHSRFHFPFGHQSIHKRKQIPNRKSKSGGAIFKSIEIIVSCAT